MREFADIDDVGCVLGQRNRIELIRGHAVEHTPYQPRRSADYTLIGVASVSAFEQEQIGTIHQRAFDAAVERALECVGRIVQRAAMRRVDANDTARACHGADEDSSLGAMSMQHVRLQTPDQAREMHPRQHVGRRRLAVNGNAVNAKLEPG